MTGSNSHRTFVSKMDGPETIESAGYWKSTSRCLASADGCDLDNSPSGRCPDFVLQLRLHRNLAYVAEHFTDPAAASPGNPEPAGEILMRQRLDLCRGDFYESSRALVL